MLLILLPQQSIQNVKAGFLQIPGLQHILLHFPYTFQCLFPMVKNKKA